MKERSFLGWDGWSKPLVILYEITDKSKFSHKKYFRSGGARGKSLINHLFTDHSL
jgi:hypothetical protein